MLRIFTIAILMGATSVYASAQAQFEGVIKFKGENKTYSETSEMDWYLKNGDSRLDITSHTKEANANMNIFLVQGEGSAKMTSEGNGKKMIYDVPYSAFANAEFSSAFSADATGKKATYAGHECEEYIVKTANSVVSCWVSKTTGITPASFPSIIVGRGVFSILLRNGIQGIPLKITSKDFAGNIIQDTEVVSIQASALPASTFVIPSGYEKGN